MHIIVNKKPFEHRTHKIVCIGRNYAEHAKELNNPIPKQPLLFIKPSSTLCEFSGDVAIPNDRGSVHLETELAVLIAQPLTDQSSLRACNQAIGAMGLALDLTLRDLQNSLKHQGHPWERAKAFSGSCPVTEFVGLPERGLDEWSSVHFELLLNGQRQQYGDSHDMLFSVPNLVQQAAQAFSLSPGDIVLTGTPKGVCAITHGDQLEATLWDKQSKPNDPLVHTQATVQLNKIS